MEKLDNIANAIESTSEEIIKSIKNLSLDKKKLILEAIEEGDKERVVNYIGQWLPYNGAVSNFLTYNLIKTYNKL